MSVEQASPDAMENWQDSHPKLSHDLHKAVIMDTVGIMDPC